MARKTWPRRFPVSCTVFSLAYVSAPVPLRSPPLILLFTQIERMALSLALYSQGMRASRTNVRRCGIRRSNPFEILATSSSRESTSPRRRNLRS